MQKNGRCTCWPTRGLLRREFPQFPLVIDTWERTEPNLSSIQRGSPGAQRSGALWTILAPLVRRAIA